MSAKARFASYFRNPIFLRGFGYGGIFTATLSFYGFVFDNWRSQKKKEKDAEEQLKIAFEDGDKVTRGQSILKYGSPEMGNGVRYYSNFALVYDQQKRTPAWVAEQITANLLKGTANRKHSKFKPDPGVPEMFSAENSDYWKSGWSRGHMAPAGDNKYNQESMNESFYLSNVVPQNLDNNAGFWNRLEMYCRDLTKKYPSVHVLSGPLFMPKGEEDGKRYVKYQVIGQNGVAVPTHLFKVIVVEDKLGEPVAMATFIVPNEPINFDHKLTEYQVPMETLEGVVGMKIIPKLDRQIVGDLCEIEGCKLMDRTEFELYFIGRKLGSANTLHRLDKVWGELEEKKLQPDQYLKDLYNRKLVELGKTEEKTTQEGVR
ncbi:nuclease EXOG, mitochondrial-like [Mya arenaria]|uniref:nuclease EXOG, mitochondrial-like n=1 Tax=Mya arenaria TaxID=6604 RepID=UPI0022DEFA5B|nr:nuclease EXOG, mitochondrial-like [Mya arenaria]